jgi:hypothetical protein
MGKRLILFISLKIGMQKARNRLFLMLSSITSALNIFYSRFYDPLLGSKSTTVTVEELDASNFYKCLKYEVFFYARKADNFLY